MFFTWAGFSDRSVGDYVKLKTKSVESFSENKRVQTGIRLQTATYTGSQCVVPCSLSNSG